MLVQEDSEQHEDTAEAQSIGAISVYTPSQPPSPPLHGFTLGDDPGVPILIDDSPSPLLTNSPRSPEALQLSSPPSLPADNLSEDTLFSDLVTACSDIPHSRSPDDILSGFLHYFPLFYLMFAYLLM